ncbi:MAG: OmpA family protein [Acidobacteria bacterium]|nr:OmpA family protein [Acidobacteriota bacterium]
MAFSAKSLLRTFLLITLGIAVLGILGYLFMNRLTELSEQVNDVNQQLDQAMKELEEVAEKSEAASTRASQAEENALKAAQGRLQAEAAQAAAEKTAVLAREETERAQQDTQLAQEEMSLAQEQAQRAREERSLAQEEAQRAREDQERIRRERDQDLDRLHRAFNQIVETRRTALGLVMSLGDDSMQFNFDKSTLRPENRELLSKIVGILLTSRNYGIYVYGHTDDIGSEEYNLDLSERRAQTVRDYLVKNGIAPETITSKGFGKSRPIVPGTSAAARADNRRVEIGIVDTVISYEERVSSQVE